MTDEQTPRRRRVIIDDVAEQEIQKAADWYASRGATKQALELVDAVEAMADEIAERADSFPEHSRRRWARRAQLLDAPGPYTVIFAIADDDCVFIIAVVHGKRGADYWYRRGPK